MQYTFQKRRIMRTCMPDISIGETFLNGSWLLAAAGISVTQMLLLAEAWRQSQLATLTACVASAWFIGALLGRIAANALRRGSAPPAIVWGVAFPGSALILQLWARGIDNTSALPSSPDPATRILLCLVLALVLGLLGALWLGQSRKWEPVGARAELCRNAVCPMFGLVMVWCFPQGSDLVGLVCLLPLLLLNLLDHFCVQRISLAGRVTGNMLCPQAGPASWPPLRLEWQLGRIGWWRTYLVQQGYAVQTLLASGTAILLGALWSVLPTPFAAGLAESNETYKLIALLAGQVAALVAATWLFNNGHRQVRVPDRSVPLFQQTHACRCALRSLVGMAFGLVLLGLPALQAPVWLGISVWVYTLAATAWGDLQPRLKPGVETQIPGQRNPAFTHESVMRTGYLAYEQVIEDRANLVLGIGEGLMTAVCAPIVGLLIDHLSGGHTLILMGLALAWFLAAVLLANADRMAGQLFAQPAAARSI